MEFPTRVRKTWKKSQIFFPRPASTEETRFRHGQFGPICRYLEGMTINNPRDSMTGDSFILPALVDKKFVSRYLSSPTLVDRMLWATRHTGDQWLEIVVNPSSAV
jgi:hypothetical protein